MSSTDPLCSSANETNEREMSLEGALLFWRARTNSASGAVLIRPSWDSFLNYGYSADSGDGGRDSQKEGKTGRSWWQGRGRETS